MIAQIHFYAFLWGTLGWSAIAQATPSAELVVVGQLAVHAESEPTAEGQQIIRGRLSDEIGQPVAGEISVRTQAGRKVNAEVCPWLDPEETPGLRRQLEVPGIITVGADGSFCFVTEGEKGLVLAAQSENFIETVHDLDLGLERKLTRPRFVSAPVTLDLHSDDSHVIQILGRSESRPPEGAKLTLVLNCERTYPLGDSSPTNTRMQRFEFRAPMAARPGNCQFIAEVSAPGHKPLRAARAVLVRDEVRLQVAKRSVGSNRMTVRVTAANSQEREAALDEGLIEARENEAFVALGPVRGGSAELEFELGQSERKIDLSYVPASPALLPGKPIVLTVPKATVGFRWASLHMVGLLAFCIWLGYAWLRPKKTKNDRGPIEPPKRGLVSGSGKRTGPIRGKVFDAHTGEPLVGIVVTLSEAGVEQVHSLETITSDAEGSFLFETRLESHPMLRVAAKGEEHMAISAPTRSTNITIHLTHRRRALVQGLVAWARKAGRPWNRSPAPTPGTVEATAHERGDRPRELWAKEVATAAYARKLPTEATVETLRTPDDPV